MDTQKKQQMLLGTLIIIALAIIIILYFGYFRTPENISTLPSLPTISPKAPEILIQNIKDNLGILDNDYFKNKIIKDLELEKTGRSNPFLPF